MPNDIQEKVGAGIGIVVMLAVVGVIVGTVLIPVAIGGIEGDATATYNQSVSDSPISLTNVIEANVTGVDDNAQTATIVVNDTSDGNSAITNTISNGSNATYSLSGGDAIANVTNVYDGNHTAKVRYTWPNDYSLSDGSKALLAVVGIFLLLAILLIAVAYPLKSF